MKNLFAYILLFVSFSTFSQVKGKVTDENGNPLAAVSIHIEDTYVGTTTNEAGEYYLDIKKQGKLVIVFQYLGYKTQKIKHVFEKFLKTLDVKMEEENIELNTVVIDVKNNPANEVIRNAIASKKNRADQ